MCLQKNYHGRHCTLGLPLSFSDFFMFFLNEQICLFMFSLGLIGCFPLVPFCSIDPECGSGTDLDDSDIG